MKGKILVLAIIAVVLFAPAMVRENTTIAGTYAVERGYNMTITNPTEGDVILYNPKVTITWEYTGGGHVDYYDAYVDGNYYKMGLNTQLTVNLTDGKHNAFVQAFNGTGELSKVIGYDEVNFTVDAKPPVVYLQEPVEGELIGDSSVYVEWHYPSPEDPDYDGIPIDHAVVKIDDGSWVNVGQDTSYTFTGVEDGTHTIWVKAYDIYGLNTTKMVNFTVDSHPPILTILSPKQNAFVNKSAVMVKWEAHDGNGIAYYQIAMDYGPANDEWLYLSNQTNFYVFTNLTEGTHTVYVEAYEKAPPPQPEAPGPVPQGSYSMEAVSFTVDTTPPTLTMNPPTYLNLSAVRISWMGDDNIGVSHYEIRMDNSSWINIGMNTSYTFSGVYGRNHTVSVRAYDLANNVVEKTISLAPPSFNFSVVNSTKGMVGWRNITLDIKEYRGMELKKMRIYIYNGSGGLIFDSGWLNYTELYSITLNSTGEYRITVSVSDSVGNTANVTHTLYVDLTPPVVEQYWLKQNITTNVTNVTIHATDASGGLLYGYAVDSMFIAWYNSSTFPIYLPYKSGNYTVTLYVKDRFGHTTTETTWVNVNLTANENAGNGGGGGGNQNTNPAGNEDIWDMLIGMFILLGAIILAVVWLVLRKKKPKEHGERELTKKEKAILKELTEYVKENQGEPRGDVVKAVSTRMGVSEGEVATILDYGIENFIFEEREEEGVKRIYPLTEEEEHEEEPMEDESVNEDIPEGMVKCPVCGALNPEDAVTCSVCGAPLHGESKEEGEEKKEDEEAI